MVAGKSDLLHLRIVDPVLSDPSLAAIELKNKVLSDPTWRIKAGKNSRKLAEEYFSRDLLYQRLVDVFMSVAIK